MQRRQRGELVLIGAVISGLDDELCLNTFRHPLPNPKNGSFTTIHTTASLDLDRIDSETLRKPFRPAKITFISKSVIYAG